jgi:[ribosomal protein S18]-alanine N-acetyltransferase
LTSPGTAGGPPPGTAGGPPAGAPCGRLRVATPADGPTIAAIHAATSTTWSQAWLTDELTRLDRRYLVAEAADGRVVGFAGIALLAGDAHVMGLAVEPARQRLGWGARLLAGLLEVARAEGCEGVTLEVRSSNLAALALYRRAGFVAAGCRPRYYPDGEDAELLWWRPDT